MQAIFPFLKPSFKKNYPHIVTAALIVNSALSGIQYSVPSTTPLTITPAPRPRIPQRLPAIETPGEIKCTKPAQGRATFKPIALRRRVIGSTHPPSPSPPGFPLLKDKKELQKPASR
jgi:hypothetical protein